MKLDKALRAVSLELQLCTFRLLLPSLTALARLPHPPICMQKLLLLLRSQIIRKLYRLALLLLLHLHRRICPGVRSRCHLSQEYLLCSWAPELTICSSLL